MLIAAALLAASLSTPCTPASRPRISEVFYDAVGDDTGHEFVELFNPSDAAVSLAGMRLEAGDGSGPGRWTLRWTAGPADSMAARGRFVIGGGLVSPAPQATVGLDLQNGPDAVRVVWPDGSREVVGWGAHEFAEYTCGAPAPDVASGQSLARVPDDAELGSNADDFRGAAPSPGYANRAGRDVQLVSGSLALVPEQPTPGSALVVRMSIANAGAESIALGAVEITLDAEGAAGPVRMAQPVASEGLAPGDVVTLAIEAIAPPEGRWLVRARALLAGDESAANDADTLRMRAGPGPLRVHEIQFHPAASEGEWVELRNASGIALDMAAFTLGDRNDGRATLSEGTQPLAPESLAVIAQDRAALLARYPALDPSRVWRASSWPSLNNTDDSSGVADIVRVRERDGTPCDAVAYAARGVNAGVTIEWRDGGWWPARLAGGTPLAPPAEPRALSRRFELSARRVRAGDPALTLAWALPWPSARVRIELYDLSGRPVLHVWPEFVSPARGERALDTGLLRPGLYAVALLASDTRSGASLREVQPLRVEGRVP